MVIWLYGVRGGTDVLQFIISITQQSVVGQGPLIIENSRSHSDIPLLVRLLWTSDQPDAEISVYNTHHFQDTDIKGPGRIRTGNPGK